MAEDYESRGLSPEEARRAARRDFGIASTVKEDLRAARGIHLVDAFLQDLRYGIRLLWRNPGFATATILTIALGIGATTAVFTVVYGVVLKPLPYPSPSGSSTYGRRAGVVCHAHLSAPRTIATGARNVPSRAWR